MLIIYRHHGENCYDSRATWKLAGFVTAEVNVGPPQTVPATHVGEDNFFLF